MVRQLQALCRLERVGELSDSDAAYCRARARLPVDQFPLGRAATARSANQRAPALPLLPGRGLKALDGSTVTRLRRTPSFTGWQDGKLRLTISYYDINLKP